jgi:hypothetical protein
VGIFLVGGAQFDVKGSLHHVESLLVHHGVKTS